MVNKGRVADDEADWSAIVLSLRAIRCQPLGQWRDTVPSKILVFTPDYRVKT